MSIQGVVSSDFSQQALQGTLMDSFRDGIETANPYWKQMGFSEKTSRRAYEEFQEFAGLGPAPVHNELAQLKIDTVKKGYVIRINQTEYGVMMPVSNLALKFNQVSDAIMGMESMTESLVLCQEFKMAGVFGNAFSTTLNLYPDSQPLCSTANINPRGGTWSNRTAAASVLESSIETMLIAAKKMPGSNGYASGVKLELLVGPAEYDLKAERQLQSPNDPNSANNAINAVKNKRLRYVGNPHMESTSNWFGITDAKPGMLVIWVQRPEVTSFKNDERKATVYSGYQVFGTGVPNKRKVIGNPL